MKIKWFLILFKLSSRSKVWKVFKVSFEKKFKCDFSKNINLQLAPFVHFKPKGKRRGTNFYHKVKLLRTAAYTTQNKQGFSLQDSFQFVYLNCLEQFDQRCSYTKLLRQSEKFHQLCILSSRIQWCYPKYWKSLCH